MAWRMDKPCDNCPFNSRGPGLKLRRSLAPWRWREILRQLRGDGHFMCHKTTKEDDDGEYIPSKSDRLCAGAIAWQEKRGLSSQLQRIMERLGYIRKE